MTSPEEASINSTGIKDYRILLVVSCIRGDGNHGVDTGGQLPEAEVLHGSGGGEGLLGVVEHVGKGIHADVVVGDVDAHGLLTHSGLVGVTRRLRGRINF